MLEPDEVRQAEQERRNLCGAFLIRCKGHLDRLAQAGLDTRIVRELVLVHTLAVLACDRVDSEKWIEDINCQSFWDSLDLPVTADEGAMFAERQVAGGLNMLARNIHKAFTRLWNAYGEEIEQVIGCPPEMDGLHRALDRVRTEVADCGTDEREAIYQGGYTDAMKDADSVLETVLAYLEDADVNAFIPWTDSKGRKHEGDPSARISVLHRRVKALKEGAGHA